MFESIINAAILLIERELLKLEPEMQKMIIAKLANCIDDIIALITQSLESCTQGHISLECDHDNDDEQ